MLAAPPAQFTEHTVATGLRRGYQVAIADLNHDGKPDLIALAQGLPELVWYENPWPKSGTSDIAVGRLGKERFLATIEPWHGNQVAIYLMLAGLLIFTVWMLP